jgi:hypothetical protein
LLFYSGMIAATGKNRRFGQQPIAPGAMFSSRTWLNALKLCTNHFQYNPANLLRMKN